MARESGLTRRALGLAAAATLTGCQRSAAPAAIPARWVGAAHERGHRLRAPQADALPPAAVQRRARVLIVGAGIAGLAAARACRQQGIDDVHLLELDDRPGGNSRGHQLAGMGCPQGAHYLPVPGPHAHEVSDWLHEIGLLKSQLGRSVADERHLCHSPQERLFIDGAWSEGLLPPADPGSATQAQYRQFAVAVAQAQRIGFALPSLRAPWTAAHAVLDAQGFDTWLDAQGLTDARLRWYLDYCCRDDYGAGSAAVSAWAGLHYFASRHGFHAPGDGVSGAAADGEREPVFTWPEGNAWLVRQLAAPFADRVHTGRSVLQVHEDKHGVRVLAWNEAAGHIEAWQAERVLLAVPLFIAARLLAAPPEALRQATSNLRYAPWLVANVHISRPLFDRPGAPPSWDNVAYGSAGLGYVDAMHQSLRAAPGPTVLSFYRSLLPEQRPVLLAGDAAQWAQTVLAEAAAVHPDLAGRARQIDLVRWGHAMAIPAPGVRGSAALAALRAQRGRVRFAHSDLTGSSVFEEAFTAGHLAGVGLSGQSAI